MFDGKVARTKKDRTEVEKRFGIQIDSLADIVCFGVSPAILCYRMGMRGLTGVAILLFYVLAGLIRLAWFNVSEEVPFMYSPLLFCFYQLLFNLLRQIVDAVMHGSLHGASCCPDMAASPEIGRDRRHVHLSVRAEANFIFECLRLIQKDRTLHAFRDAQLAHQYRCLQCAMINTYSQYQKAYP